MSSLLGGRPAALAPTHSIIDRLPLNTRQATTFACFGYFWATSSGIVGRATAGRGPTAARVEIQCGRRAVRDPMRNWATCRRLRDNDCASDSGIT